MTKKNNRQEESRLEYGETPLTAAVIFFLSLFCQWGNWFVYEKLDYHWGFTLVTPVILCAAYHFVQLDAGNGNFSRKFFFIFSVLAPLAFGILLTVLMFLTNPDISNFNPDADYEGSVQEIISTYAGRFVITSLYLLIFAAIDRIFIWKRH
ncbi:MAG: hypothetical protein IJ666_04130 [Ruminococcus sp.]|nr:hypothetical protein [Ruminococcus sp.]